MAVGGDGSGEGRVRAGGPRAERLKAALRANLRRRKAQGRGRAAADDPPEEAGDRPAPGPDSDKTGL